MEEQEYTKSEYDTSKREERKAKSDMCLKASQSDDQKEQLEMLMNYRDECVEGLRTAKQSGLTIVQIREYQLLMQHLSVVVDEQQEKLDISQTNYEDSKADWQIKHERFIAIEEYFIEQDRLAQEEFVDDADESDIENHSLNKKGIKAEIRGKRLKSGAR